MRRKRQSFSLLSPTGSGDLKKETKMKNFRISTQLVALVVCMMAAFSAVVFYQIRVSKQAIYTERYEMLRTQAETALSIMTQLPRTGKERAVDA